MSSLACFPLQQLSLPTRPHDDPVDAGQLASTPSPAQEKFLAAAVGALVALIDDPDEAGSPRLSSDAFAHAARFMTMLSATLPVPEIAVDSDGDIAFDWDLGPRRVFSVRVGKGGRLHYAGLFGHATLHGSEDLHSWLPWEIQRGIERVLGNPPV